MPIINRNSSVTAFPGENYITQQTFKKGVITLLDKSRLPKDALDDAENIILTEDGQPAPRFGVDWYGTASPNAAEISGFEWYITSANAIHLVISAGTNIYRSTDNGTTWTLCTGATLTAGKAVEMNQYNNKLYITNGTDNIILYDGTTTLSQYGTLTTPTAPTVANTGLTGTGETYYYKCARVNSVGVSIASAASTVLATSFERSSWDDTTKFATLTLPAFVTDQIRYDVYLSTDNTYYYYLGSTTSTTYKDNGQASVIPSMTAPTESTASGPKVKKLTTIGNRMFGVGDTSNQYRIWFTSGATPYGAFASGLGGGYLDWQPGGKYKPVAVEDYRDGRGYPIATVWLDSEDGYGAIMQMTLTDVTIGDYTYTEPSAYKLPGSRGTPASGSVVNVLNDYLFYNSQAIYNLGTRAQITNILSTDEQSANIRPTVRDINETYEDKITSIYWDAKVFFSVPFDSATKNNITMIFDTERKAWIPKAFTIGFKKFLRYTDTAGVQRLLAVKEGDTRLSEISYSIIGDYSQPFSTLVSTGLIPVNRNRAEFLFIEQGELELSRTQGDINIELLGFDRSKGFISLKSITTSLAPGLSPYGWDSEFFDISLWDDTSKVKKTFAESSIWRYFTVQKEVRGIQWKIRTTGISDYYILRTLQVKGTATQGGHPRQERII